MINPIGNQLTPANLGLNPTASDYPAVRALTTQQVAAPGDAQSSLFQDASQNNALLKQQPEPPKSSLEKALDAVNDSLKAWSTGMRFDMDEDAHQLVVSIVDSESGEVLRKIPSEAMLRIARMIAQFQGTGVDTQA